MSASLPSDNIGIRQPEAHEDSEDEADVCGDPCVADGFGYGPAGAARTAEGKPDFNGVWQALNTAAWDIQDHSGALGVPPGQGVVEGNEIPYQPWAAAKKQENFAKRATADQTEANCYLPGVPRATYMPLPVPDRAGAQDDRDLVRVRPCAPQHSFGRQSRIRTACPTPGWAIRERIGTATRWWST